MVVLLCDKCEFDVDNVKFTDNTASVKGGAIHVPIRPVKYICAMHCSLAIRVQLVVQLLL